MTPLDDPESNLRDLKEAPALTTECEWRTPGCKTCQDVRHHKGWHSAEREFSLQRYLTRCGRLRRRKDSWTLVQMMHAETMRRSDAKIIQRRWYRNPPLVLVSNIEDIRRADAEAEKALKRARLLDERRAAKRVSATPEEMETMLVAAEAVLTETRETDEALTVSALQQAHPMSHRAETTAESFFQADTDMTVTTKEQARKKQLDFLESMKVCEEVYVDDASCWNPRHVWSLGGHDENANSLEVQVHRERLQRTSE